MRPRSLEEFLGQEHILAPGKLLRRAIEADRLPSVIFSGPPGSGTTTYNPFFYVNSALVSRSQVFRLEPLSVEHLEQLIDRALADKERGLGNYNVKIDKDARRHLAKLSDGDARKCLNALEIGVLTT